MQHGRERIKRPPARAHRFAQPDSDGGICEKAGERTRTVNIQLGRMDVERLSFGSLFAGIGGLDLGLERAGMVCKWQVENNDYCRRVLEKHWPNVPKFGDIKELVGDELEAVDLICGGFPCQPVSLAGKRKGKDDERWLWPEFCRIIRVVRPRLVLVENVPGLLSHGMGDVLGDLAELGYDAEWDSIPAAAVGAPHLRYRVFIVGDARNCGQHWDNGRRSNPKPSGRCANVADAKVFAERSGLCAGDQTGNGQRRLGDGGCAVPDAAGDRCHQGRESITATGSNGLVRNAWWATEPNVGRVAYGVPARVDRLRALGNSVVPQVAEYIGRRILESLRGAA